MKIYIDSFNYDINFKKQLEKNCILELQKKVIEIFSENGVYFVENERIFKINYIDGEVENINNYCNNKSITIDRTIVKKDMKNVYCISNNQYKINILIQRFRLREKSPLICVIEYNLDNDHIHDVYFQLHDKHAAYSSADMNNNFLKDDILSFINIAN